MESGGGGGGIWRRERQGGCGEGSLVGPIIFWEVGEVALALTYTMSWQYM